MNRKARSHVLVLACCYFGFSWVGETCKWLRGVDLNHRPLGYEPNELPDCSTPRNHHSNVFMERSNFGGLLSGWVNQYILESRLLSFFRMSLRTLNDVFFAVVERQHPKVMLERLGEEFVPISSEGLRRRVVAVAGGLRRWGIGHGDRVAILSENRPEWTIADFASLLLGAVTVPIYATLTGEQTAYILRDSGARVIFVSSEMQLRKVLSVRDQTALEKLVVMDASDSAGAVRMSEIGARGPGQPRFGARGHGPGGFSGRSRYHYLYLGHDRHSQGSDADARQHGVEPQLLAGGISGAIGRCQHFVSSTLPCHARHVDFALLYRGVTLAHLAL